jgi:hypothetical protein
VDEGTVTSTLIGKWTEGPDIQPRATSRPLTPVEAINEEADHDGKDPRSLNGGEREESTVPSGLNRTSAKASVDVEDHRPTNEESMRTSPGNISLDIIDDSDADWESDHESAEASDYSSDESVLDPEMIQLVRDRNRAAGLCDACQELFFSICKITPDHEGGRVLDPFGNDTYKETLTNIWVKGYRPTLLLFVHSSLSALTLSGKGGCGTCRVLLESLNVYRNPKYHEPISKWFVAARREQDAEPQWSVWLHPMSDENQSYHERADGHLLHLRQISGFGSSYSEPKKGSSDDIFPMFSTEIPEHSSDALFLTKAWLKNCEDSHKSCSKFSETSFHPTRLLSVSETSPRLCLTSTLPRTASLRYAALSHCWGSMNDLIHLTKANLADFQTSIPPAALCKTFRHAIRIAKFLGLDYLWIDSLCIIQDDGEDWTTEATLMCEVYSHCAISIAASSSVNGNGGCLFSRNPERRWIQQIELIRDNVPAEFFLLNSGIRKQCIEDTPLSTRAWALQEQVLAPRTLHFSSSQIFWECRELEACETLPRGLPDCFLGRTMKTWLNWAAIIHNYSSRNLTYPGDKLPAVAGLAQKVHEEIKHTYVAGLWLETITWDLPWKTSACMFEYQKPKSSYGRLDIAPSWSWASVDTTVQMPGYQNNHSILDMTSHVFVLDVQGLPSGKAAFGHVRSAALIIECEILIPVRSCGVHFIYSRIHDTLPLSFLTVMDHENTTKNLDLVLFLLPLHTRIERTYGANKYKGYALSEPAGSQIMASGLVLEKTGLGRGEYRRVGAFEPHFKSEMEVQSWVKVPKTFTPDLKETDYIKRYIDEKTGNERCTIKIN